jgi:anthranilate phosphoribosyltransferase
MSATPTAVHWPTILGRLTAGDDLDRGAARDVMGTMLAGEATAAQVAAFLVALRAKGETADELGGLLDGALAAATFVPLDETERAACVDIVGTGGDLSHSINVSTLSAIVMAAAGARVCKHGNRSASSKCGSADLLEALGVQLELHADGVAACIREVGIGFCFAPVFHPAFRHVGPIRREIGIPTVFNLLGPMANPGRVRRQLIGVADPRFARPMIEALRAQGLSHVWLVHGEGLDELTTAGTSDVLVLDGGEISSLRIDPRELGLAPATPDDLRGGDPADNAEAVRRVLEGDPGPHRDICLLNAAAGLTVAGVATGLDDGMARAAAAIDDGTAMRTLHALASTSQAQHA